MVNNLQIYLINTNSDRTKETLNCLTLHTYHPYENYCAIDNVIFC